MQYALSHTARPSDDPIGHAATSRRNGRTVRSSYTALCGAAIVWPPTVYLGDFFDPLHPRACHRCAVACTRDTVSSRFERSKSELDAGR